PRAQPGRLCAVREHRRQSADHLLLDPRRRARLDDLALAMVGALGPTVYDCAMSARPRAPAEPVANSPARGKIAGSRRADESARAAAKEPKRRGRGTADFEERIGYRFRDPALLEQALTHISALTGMRNRAGSYQRLEFLGDHVLGLVVSDMLFRA